MKNRTRITALSLCIGLAAGAAVAFVLTRTEAVAQGAAAPAAEQLKKLAAAATKRIQRS
jgi:hypothetical protein